MGTVDIRAPSSGDEARWDDYVRGHDAGTFFHLIGWRDVVQEALGHPCRYLMAERDGQVVGVLPLGQVQSALFGNALISVPFCVYGGAIGDDDDCVQALTEAAVAIATEREVDYLELRNVRPRPGHTAPDSLYVTFRKSIDSDPEANLKAIPRKQRAMVRKGMQAGLAFELDDGIDRFFELYSLSVRNLGTPVLPKRWFETVKRVFGDAVEVMTIVHEGEPVSSVLSYYFRDEVLPYYGGGGAHARSLKANDFMYYSLMNHAASRGARVFDYGRSKKGSGSYSFKKNWGFEPEPLCYEYKLIRASDPPAINPNNPKYRLAIAMWQKLPVPVTRIIGPRIARYLA